MYAGSSIVLLYLVLILNSNDALAGGSSLTKALRSERVAEVNAAFNELFRGIAVCPDCYDDYAGLSEALLEIATDSSRPDLRTEAWQLADHLLARKGIGNWQQWVDALESEGTHLERGRFDSRGVYWYLRCCGSLGERASPSLRETLRSISKRDKTSFVGVYSIIAIMRIERTPPERDTEVIQCLQDGNLSTRIYASHGISIVGNSCDAWDRELMKMVSAGTPAEAVCASEAVCKMRIAPMECVTRLREVLKAPDEQVSYFPRRISDASGPYSASLSARLIGSLGKNGIESIPDLENCIRGENVLLAIAAIHALGELSPFSEEAVSIIRRNMVNDNQDIRWAAVKVIEKHQGSFSGPTRAQRR